jgi:type IV pilus modification protein PilV
MPAPETRPGRCGVRGQAGFTLVEIIVALLLLAIGLLGVEALALNASRMMARAEKQTIWMGVAADTLERTVAQIREGSLTVAPSTPQTYQLTGGDTVRLAVSNADISNSSPGAKLWTVQVSVYPNRRGTLLQRSDSIGMVSSVVK